MHRILIALLLFAIPPAAHAFPTFATGEGFRGAELMTPEERHAHVERIRSMQTFAECRSYVDAHDAEIERRAGEQRFVLPHRVGDPCEVMRFFGRIK